LYSQNLFFFFNGKNVAEICLQKKMIVYLFIFNVPCLMVNVTNFLVRTVVFLLRL
jgi:hypothetical protein